MPRGVKRAATEVAQIESTVNRHGVPIIKRVIHGSPDASYSKQEEEHTTFTEEVSPSHCVNYHLVDHGYGVTPQHQIMREAPSAPPKTSEAVKRRLNMSCESGGGRTLRAPTVVPLKAEFKTPKHKRPQKHTTSTPNHNNWRPSNSSTNIKKFTTERSRFDTSLSLLTQKFVNLLQTSPDGVMDLNVASMKLDVQKRRIYDITNVLEGIGILEKKSKNNIQWKSDHGDSQGQNSAKHRRISKQLKKLIDKEKELDKVLDQATSHLNDIIQDVRYAYITYQDLKGISEFKDQTVIPIKAPPETQLSVPPVDENGYMLQMKAVSGEIEVFLCPKSESPPQTPHSLPSDPLLEDCQSLHKPLFDDIRNQNNMLSPLKTIRSPYNSPGFSSSPKIKLCPEIMADLKMKWGLPKRNLTKTLCQPSVCDSALSNNTSSNNKININKWQPTVTQPVLLDNKSSPTSELPVKLENIKREPLAEMPQSDIVDVCRVRNALITENDELEAMGGGNIQFQTEDQHQHSSDMSVYEFLSLEPPLAESDYSFCLDAAEGLSELFDFTF